MNSIDTLTICDICGRTMPLPSKAKDRPVDIEPHYACNIDCMLVFIRRYPRTVLCI